MFWDVYYRYVQFRLTDLCLQKRALHIPSFHLACSFLLVKYVLEERLRESNFFFSSSFSSSKTKIFNGLMTLFVLSGCNWRVRTGWWTRFYWSWGILTTEDITFSVISLVNRAVSVVFQRFHEVAALKLGPTRACSLSWILHKTGSRTSQKLFLGSFVRKKNYKELKVTLLLLVFKGIFCITCKKER